MNKTEFMGSLEKHLKYLPKEDKKDALDYYSEYIDDSGFAEGEDICAKLGNPKEIAKTIIAECTQKRLDNQEEKKTTKGSAAIVWMTILLIFSLPVTLPLAIAIFIVFISLIISIFAALLSIGLIALTFVAVGVVLAGIMFTAPGIGQKLVLFGTGLVFSAAGVLVLAGVVKLGELSVRLLVFICKKVLKRFKKKEA